MNRVRGFTLIELMVVVAIIAILAAIAIPMYGEQVRKARRAEATRSVGDLQLRLERWRAECPTFADQASCKDTDGDGTVESGEGVYPTEPTSDYYDIEIASADATSYELTATPIGVQASDRCGILTLDSAATKPVWATAACNN